MLRKEHLLSAIIGSAITLTVVAAVSCQGAQASSAGCVDGMPPYKIPEPTDPESGLAKLSQPDRETPLAVVNGVEIPLAELQDRLDKQSPYIRAKYVDPAKRKELLDQIIQFEVLSQAAAKAGIAGNPEVLRQTKQAMIQKYLEATFNKQFTVDSITDDEVSKYYDEHKDEYNKPEQVRVSHIVVADQAKAQSVLAEAQSKKDDATAWKNIVSTNSLDEATKTKGGDLGYFSADDSKIDSAVRDAAFKLQNNGEMVTVANAQGQWEIIKLISRRKELKRDLEAVAPQIKQKLFQDRKKSEFDKFVGELKAKAAITANEGALSKLELGATPPPGPGGNGPLPIQLKPQDPNAPTPDPAALTPGGATPAPTGVTPAGTPTPTPAGATPTPAGATPTPAPANPAPATPAPQNPTTPAPATPTPAKP